ncbi:Y-family DNA polymerase [Dyadobacter luticola]|uniref:DNA polymerase Y family protein n=1 Tax=Dyadobacter luticola TaxID=1979387 RepID=A0A5R9L1K5_9BACT|nr:DNA polymerase Y family protein [Dyadobacter luticola]TLV02239.1 DNA polymerase Y family protein [Dyadobacter luticola]
MPIRYAHLWFPRLTTDYLVAERPELADTGFVLAVPSHGRMVVSAASPEAVRNGVGMGMVIADARAIYPTLEVMDDQPEKWAALLKSLAEWCIRYTPVVAVIAGDGLILDISGCAYLWGGEASYLQDMVCRLNKKGYQVRAAIADTIGAAWAMAHYGGEFCLIGPGRHEKALLSLPPAALRLEPEFVERMNKLGLYQIRNFIKMPRSVLRRRFGQSLLDRVDQALGKAIEIIQPVIPQVPYQERLPCMEPIVTAVGIQIALRKLLEMLCCRLVKESKGIRTAVFKGLRVDGKIEQIDIVTNKGSCHIEHLFRLFELKIATIEPDLGIELFMLEAPVVEDVDVFQETLWNMDGHVDDVGLMELLDRLAGRAGLNIVHRYVPDEHYWPERSVKMAESVRDKPEIHWRTDKPRPMRLLNEPQPIYAMSPVPDYPPMSFGYNGHQHNIKRADGPERIEREWWLEDGLHRDYYYVEDENGARYWVFRLGHYDEHQSRWYIHGFFV